MAIRSLNYVIDVNANGSISLWELWEFAKFIYRLPGNLVVEGLGNLPYVAPALNLHASAAQGYSSLNGTLAVALSLVFWVAVLFAVLTWASPTDVTRTDNDADTAMKPLNTSAAPPPVSADSGVSAGEPARQALHHRPHHPVSRPAYAAPGTQPARKRHRLRHTHWRGLRIN
jgi:hypothetical protein